MKTYIRGTNNKDEEILISKGLIRKSKNSLNGKYEAGLSVSDPEHFKNISNHFDHVYELYGDEVGIGSDGEPLLDTKKLKFIKWIKKKEHEEMNKAAAARRPLVGQRPRMSFIKKEHEYGNSKRKDYNDIHFNVKNNYQNHMLNQQPSRESQRSNIINPGLHEKSTTYSKSKEKASLTRKDPDYYSEKYIKDSAEKAKSDRVDKSRHIMSAINKSDVARSRDGYYRLPETNNSNGLSAGAKLGIGAGGAVIGALALRRYLKKRRQAKEQGEKK